MKLGGGDFRFLAAWVQGIDVRDAWDRYCPHRGPADLRRIRTAVRTMLDQLAGVARRHGDVVTAALLRRDPGRIRSLTSTPRTSAAGAPKSSTKAPTSAAAPSLDQFAATLADADFYSQAELLELWTERFGKLASEGARPRDTPQMAASKRRARLVTRQLEALRQLEHLAATSPVPQDETSAWLDEELVRRLKAVGILRLQDVMFYVNTSGYRWYRKVPRVGEEGAKRLGRWLREHEASLGALQMTAMVPRAALPLTAKSPAPTFAVVPIERLQVPTTLSGAAGSNRAPLERCRIDARDDHQALQAWLELRRPTEGGGNAHTWRAYRKEAERFLLWALFERHKPLSSLDAADCVEFRRFLAAPGPMWVGTKSAPRWSPHWRPFEGSLAPRSRRMAEVVVDSMCGWLVEVRYLDSNPWAATPKAGRRDALGELRSLSDNEWHLVDTWLDGLPVTRANERLRAMFRLALQTGMREAELANARAGWLLHEAGEGGEPGWTLQVVGKGGKVRELPLMQRTVELIARSLEFKGLVDDINGQGADFSMLDPDTPLLSALDEPMRPMAPARVYELMKAALESCAASVERGFPIQARRIRRASPHWLRHTHGRKFVEGGGDRGVLRDNLGHASLATTGIYDRSDLQRRRRELEKVFGSS